MATIFYQLLSIGPFLKHWPLKQVFRAHFGPQVQFLAETLLEYLASEKTVLASESNLSLATGLAS